MRRQKIIILPKLHDCKGDLSGAWFVYYSCRHPQTGKMERFRIYEGFRDIPTAAGRKALGAKLIREYSDKLMSGWTPWQGSQAVIYEDQIEYASIVKNFGKKKTTDKNIRFYISQFLTVHRVHWADKSFSTYQSKLRIFTQWCEMQKIDRKEIDVITRPVLEQFFRFLIGNQLSEVTIKKYREVLWRFLEDLQRQRVIHQNPIEGIVVGGVKKDLAPKPILKDDLERLKEAILLQDPQLWLACQFQFYCFIRPGTELRLLRIGDIDLHSRIIKITSERAKNRKTEIVQIPSHFARQLSSVNRLQDYPKSYFLFGVNQEPGEEPLGINAFRERFNRIRDALCLSKEYKFYSWKHTGATAAVDAGIPERHLMNQLRHKSFESTDHYFRRHVGYRSPLIDSNFPEI